ncbi:hypothetical protein Cni_G13301 [Canna indica]|uniref:RNA-directed DNA polymerase (Reverse transcriptase) n=1 Tax=Canna indica TaxID=4628 RepID=A0AAQ3KBL0_9LILI|nr:hypothetical protein Cni_G13301 [Canna indica]
MVRNKNKVGSLEGNLRVTLNKLALLEEKDAKGWLLDNEIVHLEILARRAGALTKQLQLKWWSKARVRWIEEGEKNSKFFHNLVKVKRRRSKIEILEVEGTTFTDCNDMVEQFARWYENLWRSPNVCLGTNDVVD